MLKLESKIVKLVEESELSKFITEVYNLSKKFEMIALEELNNGDYKLFKVQKGELTNYERTLLTEFKQGIFSFFITDTILKDLCNKG